MKSAHPAWTPERLVEKLRELAADSPAAPPLRDLPM
jgi:hypothetical protein